MAASRKCAQRKTAAPDKRPCRKARAVTLKKVQTDPSLYLTCPKIANRSDFSLAKTVHASRVTKEILPRTGEKLTRLPTPLMFASVRTRSEAKKIQQEAFSDIKLQALKDVQAMTEVQDALDHGKSLRGKSARSIEFQLRAEALKNLSKSQELADIRKFQRETVHSLWDDKEHGRLMDERTKALIDVDKLTQPLNLLSRELRGFEQKSNNYFLDKRYRDRAKREFLYDCRGCEYYNVKRGR